ncbi:hypothetical protein VPH35_083051 [Triticum aestivum]|uniref:Uncharacterized protein n=1 Tax=Triticum turgidum subsp. durum TaxID=4567 RepID=A0A9R0TS42_TRITD|nr:unnamed protein product [Triticum turgidum subsp. durum]
MSSGDPMEFGEHRVEIHVRETVLSVVYTIDPTVVDDYINNVEQLLAGDKHKVVGTDLQYTAGRPGIDQKVVVAQLCVRHHVLIYHYCMATEPCNCFNRFVNNTDYKFSTVETTNNVKAPNVTGLACKNLVKIRDHYRVWGSTKKDSLVELASAIIDPYYEKMKQDAQRTSPVSWHGAWMRQLDEPHVRFAAKSMYTCYEMHK